MNTDKATYRLKGFQGLGRVLELVPKTEGKKKKEKENTKPFEIEESPTYETLHIEELVSVRIDNDNPTMTFFPTRLLPNGEIVEEYWRSGKPFSGIRLNVHYYGIKKEDFGKKIVATVYVIKKTLPDSRTFIHLNVYRTHSRNPTKILGYTEDSKNGFEIIGTNKRIEFQKR